MIPVQVIMQSLRALREAWLDTQYHLRSCLRKVSICGATLHFMLHATLQDVKMQGHSTGAMHQIAGRESLMPSIELQTQRRLLPNLTTSNNLYRPALAYLPSEDARGEVKAELRQEKTLRLSVYNPFDALF